LGSKNLSGLEVGVEIRVVVRVGLDEACVDSPRPFGIEKFEKH